MTTFSKIIERYGDEAVLYTGAGTGVPARCFIQPVLPRTTVRVFEEATPLGMKNTARYYGFFPAETAIGEGTYVICDGVSYDILRSERYRVNGQDSHWETLMVRREAAYDG